MNIFRNFIITVHNSGCRKVMFKQVSVCAQGAGGVQPPGRHPPLSRHRSIGRQPHPPRWPLQRTVASYWNAFLVQKWVLTHLFNWNRHSCSHCRAMKTKSWRKITRGFIPRKIHGTYIQAGGH